MTKSVHHFLESFGPLFEDFFVISREGRYDLMCGLHAYNKRQENSTNQTDFSGGQTLPEDSNIIPRISICVTINFIDA